MIFLAGLVSMYLLLWLISLTGYVPALKRKALRGAGAAAIMFILVGTGHFLKAEKFVATIPQNWPFKHGMNYISGAAEILLGAGLLLRATRLWCAYGLIALLVLVFPANINMALVKPDFYNISRLFFQPVYIAWIYWFCVRKEK